MDIQLNPVYAMILVRDSPDATHASVLLPADEFDVYRDDFDKPKSIITAAHLGKAARTRAEMELADREATTPLSDNVLVFNTHSLLQASNQTMQSISKADRLH